MQFSVIVPVFNRETLVLEALESVLSQTNTPGEIIVADDGSTDNTLGEVRNFLSQNSLNIPWQILSLSHTGMAGAVRNHAVKSSHGEWLAFLDSDDLWEPDKLILQACYIREHPNCRLIHAREKWLRGSKIISQKKQKHKREGDIFEDGLVKCIIGPSTTVIRRDLWEQTGGFREDLEIAEDYELWLRVTANERVGYIDQPLITKRAGEWDNLSDKYGQIEKYRLDGLEHLIKTDWFRHNCEDSHRYELALKEFQRKGKIYALGCEKRGRKEEAELWSNKVEDINLLVDFSGCS